MRKHIKDLLVSASFAKKYIQAMNEIYGTANPVVLPVDNQLDTLLSTVYAFDETTGKHLDSAEVIAGYLADKMCISEFDMVGISLGAMLHDVGKVGINHNIIAKPGPITDAERTIVETHTEIGRSILSHMKTPWNLGDYAYMHHERLDGTGYPRKLLAEQIPLNIRIMSIVDVTDALMADRPYRKGMSLSSVLDYFYENSFQYDINVVKALENYNMPM